VKYQTGLISAGVTRLFAGMKLSFSMNHPPTVG